jgi:hypothetical protein
VVARREAVDCNESRFWRTEAERTIPDMMMILLDEHLTHRRTFLSATLPHSSPGPTCSLNRPRTIAEVAALAALILIAR